ncbi:MAG: branched-chain amino acid ABC transporter permease [Lautropia sp.]
MLALCACSLAPLSATWLDLSIVAGVMSLIALSFGFSYGQGGVLTLAQGAFAAIGAYATGFLSTRFGLSPYIGLILALLLPAVLGWGVARMVSRLPPLATALATLAFGTIVSVVVRHWDSVTGGFIGISGVPPVPGFDDPVAFNVLAWSFVCIAVLLCECLVRSAHGRALRVIRHDAARAIADGINVSAILGATLAMSGAIAGAAGWLYVHHISYMSPESLDNSTSISALLMAIVGGAGYIFGPILGTVILTVLGHFLPAQEAQGLFYGGCLVLILLIAREGVLGAAASVPWIRPPHRRSDRRSNGQPSQLPRDPAASLERPDFSA